MQLLLKDKKKRMKNIRLALLFVMSIYGTIATAQTNTTCATMLPICTDDLLTFDIYATGGGMDPGNNDGGCLVPTVGTNWFYLKIGTSGNIDMTMTAPIGVDLDFVVWGPFTNLTAAQNACGNLGNAPNPLGTVDCGPLGGNTENINIAGATSGEIYVLLITIPTGNPSTTFELTLDPSSTGSTDCSVVLPPCDSDPGTFTLLKNGSATTSPIELCAGQSFQIQSNNDYALPTDTISYADGGDSAYTAQLMFLLYTAPPTSNYPFLDPAYTGVIIPSDTLLDTNKVTISPFLDSLDINCGTIYFVPVAGDDGIGLNNNMVGVGDNGQVGYDLDSNLCYVLGTPIVVKYNCEINVNATIVCTGTSNSDPSSIAINVNGGEGLITLNSIKDGTLSNAGPVTTPIALSLNGIFHLDTALVYFTDEQMCMDSIRIYFSKPQFKEVTMQPAANCGALGYVAIEGDDTTGNGGIVSITMNTIVELNVTPPIDTLFASGGTQVTTILTDAAGCQTDTVNNITILNGQHVTGDIISIEPISCFGANDGYAIVTASSVDGNGDPNSGVITSVVWSHSGGTTYIGTALDTALSVDNIVAGSNPQVNWVVLPGAWTATVVDNFGCSKTFNITIEEPDPITNDNSVLGLPTCDGLSNGSINIIVKGGTFPMASYTVVGVPSGTNYPTVGNSVSGLGAGTYNITLVDDNGCVGSFPIELQEPLSIDATFNINDNHKVKCYGDSTAFIDILSLINVPTTIFPLYISWELPGIGNPNVTINSITDLPVGVSGLPAGTYNLEIIDANACPKSWDFTIGQEDSLYISSLTLVPAFCRTGGFQNGNGEMDVTAIGGKGNKKIVWEEIATGDFHNAPKWAAKNTGEYTVTISDDNQCVAERTFTLDSINPVSDFFITSDEFYVSDIYEGDEELNIKVEVADNITQTFLQEGNPNSDEVYQWNLNAGNINDEDRWFLTYDSLVKPDTSYLGASVDNATIYEVCLITKNYNDCSAMTCKEVKVHSIPQLILPNVFTPGGGSNSQNETFYFPYIGVNDFTATIFDRYGIKVFEFEDIKDEWNGLLKGDGKECSDGVYFYVYKGTTTNGTEVSGDGTVTLVRSK